MLPNIDILDIETSLCFTARKKTGAGGTNLHVIRAHYLIISHNISYHHISPHMHPRTVFIAFIAFIAFSAVCCVLILVWVIVAQIVAQLPHVSMVWHSLRLGAPGFQVEILENILCQFWNKMIHCIYYENQPIG